MNAKKCKAIRRRIGRLALNADTTYETIQRKPKVVATNQLNEDGTQKMVTIVPVTIVLGDCSRRYYQYNKKHLQ